jgi:His-Xaa-Ser system protein HxsD
LNELIVSDKRRFELSVDVDVYSLEVCKKACYALMSLMSCQLEKNGEKVLIDARVNTDVSQDESELMELLLDELLDYSLRESISSKTEGIRNVILSNAFSNSRLID